MTKTKKPSKLTAPLLSGLIVTLFLSAIIHTLFRIYFPTIQLFAWFNFVGPYLWSSAIFSLGFLLPIIASATNNRQAVEITETEKIY